MADEDDGGMRVDFLKPKTVRSMREMLWDLARVGEIHHYRVRHYGLSDTHLLVLARSGLAAITPYGLVAMPGLLSVLPVRDEAELLEKLGLPGGYTRVDLEQWAELDSYAELWGNGQMVVHGWPEVFETRLNSDYIALGKIFPVDECEWRFRECAHHAGHPVVDMDAWHVVRPTLLYPYVPIGAPIDDWDLEELDRLPQVFRNRSCHVFSTLGIRTHHDLELEVWGNPFYWLAVQMLILSDRETGAAYEYGTRVHLPHRFDDPRSETSPVTVCLNGAPVCSFLDIVDTVFPRMSCLWVNRWEQPDDVWPQVMSVFRLLYKAGMLERQPDGWLGLSERYRRSLVEKDNFNRRYFNDSRDVRNEIRELIIGMADGMGAEANP